MPLPLKLIEYLLIKSKSSLRVNLTDQNLLN